MSGMKPMDRAELEGRKQLARMLLAEDPDPPGSMDEGAPPLATRTLTAAPPGLTAARAGDISFPSGLRPTPSAPSEIDPQAALPNADVLVVTWTAAECDALADVFTPGVSRQRWHFYRHNFTSHFLGSIRPGAPSRQAGRLGSWLQTSVGDTSVTCFKSELHLNQDGVRTGDGTATLPVKDLFAQLIEEVKPALVLTIGTAGGVATDQDLGDAVVTRAARFRCQDEFENEPFNGRTFRSEWTVPKTRFTQARKLMESFASQLVEPPFAPPTKRYPFAGQPIRSDPPNRPNIKLDGDDFPEFHPILTTDFFEFGTSANRLDDQGCGVEMGDAALGLACSEMGDPPDWAVVRNVSDPVINADLPTSSNMALNMQAHWAVWFYEAFGYWTSVSGALATWGIVAGLDSS
jgi:nucleoside phosphorylase